MKPADCFRGETKYPSKRIIRFVVIALLRRFSKGSNMNHQQTVQTDEKTDSLVNSYASDLIHSITKIKVLTEKHFFLGVRLHNLTGQRNVVKVVNRLGQPITHVTVCDIETAEIMNSQELFLESQFYLHFHSVKVCNVLTRF